jgi:hypothetical protein
MNAAYEKGRKANSHAKESRDKSLCAALDRVQKEMKRNMKDIEPEIAKIVQKRYWNAL